MGWLQREPGLLSPGKWPIKGPKSIAGWDGDPPPPWEAVSKRGLVWLPQQRWAMLFTGQMRAGGISLLLPKGKRYGPGSALRFLLTLQCAGMSEAMV